MSKMLALVGLLVTACGGGDGDGAADARPAAVDATTADAAASDAAASLFSCTAPGSTVGTHKVFLQFEGQTIVQGATDDATADTSSIGGGTLAAYQPDAVDRAAQITMIVDAASDTLAPYDVEITTTRPAAGPYAMIVLGGRGPAIGVPDNVVGVSAFTCAVIPNAVGFVFDHALIPLDIASEVVAILGLVAGIPSSNVPGECMCWTGLDCGSAFPLSAPCTLGGVDTEIAPGEDCGLGTAMDPRYQFELAYGCRP